MTATEKLQNDTPRVIVSAAERLAAARRTATPCPPVRDLLGTEDVAAAYEVQQRFVDDCERDGARIVGRKIGLTSPAVQRQLGVDQPDFGVLFADMDVSGLSEVPVGVLLQPKVEAEVAFALSADLDGPTDLETVRAAVGHAVAAIEIVDSRVAAWDITITDTVADNASSGLFVLGDNPVSLADFEPISTSMTMSVDGEVVSEGTGADCLGDPLIALQWLARTAADFGSPLRAGQVVLSGALGPMAPVHPGSVVRAEISGLGIVEVSFARGDL
ncbi:2-keto-4-pentenoate hydratase [Gordonia polyisoprenivorans]|uniref:2-keto-4-pentenoate hydratase n=1 Tax=Gordonia polyisoprenivorans TaxID=84595 RepID=UPI000B99DDA4|nr:fumarylacetoacetate hydrolase family protein [Gordonia polyisoprenivorans]MBE7195323.1 fumarylacetoacetate hydrolase family protein [Gordonia polyisoprenivorans]OZC29521.1 2-keto-4-pentenoate hydratase [Gordonia polyisoprenivorans]UZF57951.1 fumarylacetoacetate hydrolase family protein [Gordonia polyisoprenivorans]WCB38969.1 fumarylacetoacetate hydrolase family protein [Gordonia polyisoprenivorans]